MFRISDKIHQVLDNFINLRGIGHFWTEAELPIWRLNYRQTFRKPKTVGEPKFSMNHKGAGLAQVALVLGWAAAPNYSFLPRLRFSSRKNVEIYDAALFKRELYASRLILKTSISEDLSLMI